MGVAWTPERRAAFEAQKARMMGSRLISRQNVAAANSGVDPTVGTPASVMADTRLMSELDARMAESNASREVRGYRLAGEQAKRKSKVRGEEIDSNENAQKFGGIIEGWGSMLSMGMTSASMDTKK